MRARRRRSGYTLLEVLLATAIGVLLLGALYEALHITIRQTQAGRDKVEQSTLARALLARIANDIASNLKPTMPIPSSSSSGQGGGGAAAQTGAAATTTTDPNATQNTSGSATPSTSGTVSGLNGPVTFNLGVQGDSERLVLYVSRVPREVYVSGDIPTVSDLREITIWLTSHGLARQEIKVATSDDALNGLSANLPDDPSFVIAPEITKLSFQYFDGSTWQDTWDGTTTPTSGGSNPQGPPLAIAITIGIAVPGSGLDGGEVKEKLYRHVVAIPTANGASQSTSGTTSP